MAKSEEYWNNVLVQASIAAMQGIQESGKVGLISDMVPEELAKLSVKIGKALVKELKENIDYDQQNAKTGSV